MPHLVAEDDDPDDRIWRRGGVGLGSDCTTKRCVGQSARALLRSQRGVKQGPFPRKRRRVGSDPRYMICVTLF